MKLATIFLNLAVLASLALLVILSTTRRVQDPTSSQLMVTKADSHALAKDAAVALEHQLEAKDAVPAGSCISPTLSVSLEGRPLGKPWGQSFAFGAGREGSLTSVSIELATGEPAALANDRDAYKFSLIERWALTRRTEKRTREDCRFVLQRLPLNEWRLVEVAIGAVSKVEKGRVAGMAPDMDSLEWETYLDSDEDLSMLKPKDWADETEGDETDINPSPAEAEIQLVYLTGKSVDEALKLARDQIQTGGIGRLTTQEVSVGTLSGMPQRSFTFECGEEIGMIRLIDRGGQVLAMTFIGSKKDPQGWGLIWNKVISSLHLGPNFARPPNSDEGSVTVPGPDGQPIRQRADSPP